MKKQVLIGAATACVTIAALFFGWQRLRTNAPRLPYEDSFTIGRVNGWTPYGGSWRLHDDTISVSSSEAGAKLTLGSHAWKNYQLWADVQLLGHNGAVGVMVRVSDAAVGLEAIHGYDVNLRTADAGFEIARASHVFLSLQQAHLGGGVFAKIWYRVHVVAVGCRIMAEAINLDTGNAAYSGFEDSPALCLQSGGIALRTTATAAAWRHVRVEKATAADADAITLHVKPGQMPSYPIREREYSAMRESYLAQVPANEINRPTNLGTFGPVERLDAAELVGIDAMRSQLWNAAPVRMVGVVTSTSPLYLQDPTGGIHLGAVPSVVFRSGDEVEVLGRPVQDGPVLRFDPIAGRFLSDRVPVVALSVTATQAASGWYEGSLIEVTGTVRSSETLPGGQSEMLLEDGTQDFNMRVPYDLFQAASPKLEANSRVRVRGVCAMDRSKNPHRGTFVLFATSSADVTLLDGPPWWTGQRLMWLICGCFVLIGGGVALYGIEERIKLRVVQEERERLSHDMHDTLAQSLAGVGFRLQGIHRSLKASGAVPQVYMDDLKLTCDLVASTHREASASIAALHPASQQDADVLLLLERAVYSMLDDQDFPVIVSSHGNPRQLSPVVADTLYRVGREAIANALRHSQAKSIKVQLLYRSRDVVLSVTDDGVGFDFVPAKIGFGIRSMTRRCETIKAKISLTSMPEGGCRVQVVSPYRVHRGLVRWVG
ncbi:MAG: ATP-binding protein [Acidobacteriota bacterium]